MKKCVACFSLVVFSFSLCKAQHHSTSDSAIVVVKPFYGPVYALGKEDPNLALKKGSGVYFEKPHSVIWFTIVIPEDTVFIFDIMPVNPREDVDFVLFKAGSGNFENDVKQHKIVPVRSNIARCDTTVNGRTGLTGKAGSNHEPPGKHEVYSTAITVKKGERFYLAIDNYSSANNPFCVLFHLHWPGIPNLTLEQYQQQFADSIGTWNTLHIVVVDKQGKPVKTRLKIWDPEKKQLKDTNKVSKLSTPVTPGQSLVITSITPGYFMLQTSYTVPDEGGIFYDTLRLRNIRAHESFTLKNIEFESNMAIFMPEAHESLEDLVDFMKMNPSIKVVIKGYVNDTQHKVNENFAYSLSIARSVEVSKYLTKRGVDKARMECKGFGIEKQIYPDPKTPEEVKANRRVEIEVK